MFHLYTQKTSNEAQFFPYFYFQFYQFQAVSGSRSFSLFPPFPLPFYIFTRKDLFLHWLCKSGHFRVNQDLKRAGWHEVCIKEWYVDKWQRHGLCGNKNTLGDIFVRGPHFTASKMQKHQELRLLSLSHDCRSRSVCTLLPTHWIVFSFLLLYQKLSKCNAVDEKMGFSVASGLAENPYIEAKLFTIKVIWLANGLISQTREKMVVLSQAGFMGRFFSPCIKIVIVVVYLDSIIPNSVKPNKTLQAGSSFGINQCVSPESNVVGQMYEDPVALATHFQSQEILLQFSEVISCTTQGTRTTLLVCGRGRDRPNPLVFPCPVSQPSTVGKDCLFDPSIQLMPVVDSSLSFLFLETMWFYHADTELCFPCLKLELDAEQSKSERWVEERQCNDRMFHMPLNF